MPDTTISDGGCAVMVFVSYALGGCLGFVWGVLHAFEKAQRRQS